MRILLTRMAASSAPKEANGTDIQPAKPGGSNGFTGKLIPFFQTVVGEPIRAESEQDAAMPKIRPTTAKKPKRATIARICGRPAKPRPKLSGSRRRASVEIGEIVRKRAEAEAAIADARKSHDPLAEAIDIPPQSFGILDPKPRLLLCTH